MPLDSWCWKNLKLGLKVTKFISSWGGMAKMGKNEVKQSWVKRWWRKWVWWFWVLIIAFEDQVPIPWLGQIAQHPSQPYEPADLFFLFLFSSVQLLSHVQLCDAMNCSMPGLRVHHQLPELTQTQVHWVSDAIQPSHPLSSPSPPALNLSQHQGLFKWVNSSHQVAKVLEFQLQNQSFQWIFRTDLL